jgi:hypothetical protein
MARCGGIKKLRAGGFRHLSCHKKEAAWVAAGPARSSLEAACAVERSFKS